MSNPMTISRPGNITIAGRLTSDRAYTYTYDAYNNITKKVGAGKTYTFTYDTSKKTRLKSMTDNGEVQYFSYDPLFGQNTLYVFWELWYLFQSVTQ